MIKYAFLLKGLSGCNASPDKLDPLNLFICRLSQGEFPSSVSSSIENKILTITSGNKRYIISPNDDAEYVHKTLSSIFNNI